MGGLGSGKSTVAAELAKLGCKVIDADKIAHELLDKPVLKSKLVDSFGEVILDLSGRINRRKLADIAFADAEKLSLLNEIIHPPVLYEIEELIKQSEHQNKIKAIVLDMPLLLEVGWEKKCDKLIFVKCDQSLRAERIQKADVLNEKQLKIRENFQISLDKKESIADNTIDNNSGFSVLTGQVTDIFSCIMGK